MKKLIILLLIITLHLSCSNNNPTSTSNTTTNVASYIDVTPEEAKSLIDTTNNIVIVDVSPKYDIGHIPGSINFYIGNGSLDSAISKLDTSFTYLVYCHVDAASIPGAQKFIDNGFKNVYRLKGNYGAWVDAGYSIESSDSSYIDLSPATIKTLIDGNKNVVTIDVSSSYASGHLPKAINYPISTLDEEINSLDSSKIYIVYCHGDAPSISGATKIFNAGYTPTYRLKGNYSAWVDAGFPIEK